MSAPRWRIYYRGSLSSCNYACGYCPFAKTANTRKELHRDQREVERFVGWAASRKDGPCMEILFTPWGEALGHRYYRRALIELSWLAQVRRVAIQTNLSAPLTDLYSACPATLRLWATYHPDQVPLVRFLARCRQLDQAGIRYSVGIVGVREHLDAMERLRRVLSPQVYLWVNAYKRVCDYYSAEEIARITAVDPYFSSNAQRYPSLGKPCSAGETHFTVDGQGNVRRCHFVGEVLTSIYAQDLETHLRPRLCPLESCGCYIGYVHLLELGLEDLYGGDLLARIPQNWP